VPQADSRTAAIFVVIRSPGRAAKQRRYGKAECECPSGFQMERRKGSIDENFKFGAVQ
jgi:hypothetical protein